MELKNNEIYFAKLREGAKIPSKDVENGGYDIYACFDEEYIQINPGEIKLIPTGICSAFSDDYVLMLKERGSTGTKGMSQRCGIIDSGYRNEWFSPINNTSNKTIIISKDIEKTKEYIFKRDYSSLKVNSMEDVDRLYTFYPYSKAVTQALLLPVPKVSVVELSAEELQVIPSKRGMGALGSSGK